MRHRLPTIVPLSFVLLSLFVGAAAAVLPTRDEPVRTLWLVRHGEYEHDVVVCHGNVIRWFTAKVLKNDPENWLEASIANCSITVVQVRADGSTKLISFADSGHIPWSMTTYPGVTVEQ
jgi:serine/threonine-protein phosphatase PGAM5